MIKKYLVSGAMLWLLPSVINVAMAATPVIANIPVNFTATVTAGTCDISLASGASTEIDFDEVNKSNTINATKDVILVTECSGVAASKKIRLRFEPSIGIETSIGTNNYMETTKANLFVGLFTSGGVAIPFSQDYNTSTQADAQNQIPIQLRLYSNNQNLVTLGDFTSSLTIAVTYY